MGDFFPSFFFTFLLAPALPAYPRRRFPPTPFVERAVALSGRFIHLTEGRIRL